MFHFKYSFIHTLILLYLSFNDDHLNANLADPPRFIVSEAHFIASKLYLIRSPLIFISYIEQYLF